MHAMSDDLSVQHNAVTACVPLGPESDAIAHPLHRVMI